MTGAGAKAALNRDLTGKTFVDDYNKWKEQENEFVSEALTKLNAAVEVYASSDDGWRTLLQLLAAGPSYSALNNLWARAQFRARGVRDDGIFQSEANWAKQGRRVKAEFARPDKRRDARYDYDNDRAWDSTYTAEISKPNGGFKVKETDSAGRPLLDANGKPRERFIPTSYSTMLVYHEDATEAIDGGPAPALTKPPWEGATGSDADATQLLDDLAANVLADEGLALERRELSPPEATNAAGQAAFIAGSVDGRDQIVADTSKPVSAQAAAVLEIACERNVASLPAGATDDDRAVRTAAVESSKFVLASLYGLETSEQAFPHLARAREQAEGKGLKSLRRQVEGSVRSLMGRLDPNLAQLEKAKAASAAEYKERKKAQAKKRAASKRAKAKKSKKASPAETTAAAA